MGTGSIAELAHHVALHARVRRFITLVEYLLELLKDFLLSHIGLVLSSSTGLHGPLVLLHRVVLVLALMTLLLRIVVMTGGAFAFLLGGNGAAHGLVSPIALLSILVCLRTLPLELLCGVHRVLLSECARRKAGFSFHHTIVRSATAYLLVAHLHG